jgi:hypothetical protein
MANPRNAGKLSTDLETLMRLDRRQTLGLLAGAMLIPVLGCGDAAASGGPDAGGRARARGRRRRACLVGVSRGASLVGRPLVGRARRPRREAATPERASFTVKVHARSAGSAKPTGRQAFRDRP